jgi:hypothetical protein
MHNDVHKKALSGCEQKKKSVLELVQIKRALHKQMDVTLSLSLSRSLSHRRALTRELQEKRVASSVPTNLKSKRGT